MTVNKRNRLGTFGDAWEANLYGLCAFCVIGGGLCGIVSCWASNGNASTRYAVPAGADESLRSYRLFGGHFNRGMLRTESGQSHLQVLPSSRQANRVKRFAES